MEDGAGARELKIEGTRFPPLVPQIMKFNNNWTFAQFVASM